MREPGEESPVAFLSQLQPSRLKRRGSVLPEGGGRKSQELIFKNTFIDPKEPDDRAERTGRSRKPKMDSDSGEQSDGDLSSGKTSAAGRSCSTLNSHTSDPGLVSLATRSGRLVCTCEMFPLGVFTLAPSPSDAADAWPACSRL